MAALEQRDVGREDSTASRAFSMASQRSARRPVDLERSPEAMEKLLFELDENSTSDYLKDLISAAGLRGAWGEMSKRMRHVATSHAKLMALASREALNRDYVTRPEYKATVQEEHFDILEDHKYRIATTEHQVQGEIEARKALAEEHAKLTAKLDSEISVVKPELKKAQDWLKSLDIDVRSRHHEVLDAIQRVETDSESRDAALHKEIKSLEGKLVQERATREVLAMEVERQKSFLSGEVLRQHIIDTCNEALKSYVCKAEMMMEVETATEHMRKPLSAAMERLDKVMAATTDELNAKDVYLEQCLENAELRLKNADADLAARIDSAMEQLETKAATKFVLDVESKLSDRADAAEGLCDKVRRQTTHKVQEVVTRLGEFQVILQDHEHALQHQAEEMLNRATKYEMAVCTERLDKCALKEKVDGEIKDMKHTISWTATKVESMAFDKSFGTGGGGGGSRGLSRTATRQETVSGMVSRSASQTSGVVLKQPQGSRQTSNLTPDADRGSSSCTQAEESAQAVGTILEPRANTEMMLGLPKTADDEATLQQGEEPKPALKHGEASCDNDGRLSPRNSTLVVDGEMQVTGSLHDHLLSQQEFLDSLQDQLQQMQAHQDGPVAGSSTQSSLMHQQLEYLAQAVLGIGRACLRPRGAEQGHAIACPSQSIGLKGLHRDARFEHSSELLHHISSVLYWIQHRRRPAGWDPVMLTTCALCALPPPGSDLSVSVQLTEPDASPVSVKSSKAERLERLRQESKACSASPRRPSTSPMSPEMPSSSGRAFASGGSGWRHRGIAASRNYKEATRPVAERPATSGPALAAGGLPPANGTQMRLLLPSAADSAVPSPGAKGASNRKAAGKASKAARSTSEGVAAHEVAAALAAEIGLTEASLTNAEASPRTNDISLPPLTARGSQEKRPSEEKLPSDGRASPGRASLEGRSNQVRPVTPTSAHEEGSSASFGRLVTPEELPPEPQQDVIAGDT